MIDLSKWRWEFICEQLAFETELSDVLIEGQDCLLMSARWLNVFRYDAELDLEGVATNRSINRLISMRQERFENRFRRLGNKVNRLSTWTGLTKGDIEQESDWLDDNIEDGRAPMFYEDERKAWWM